MIHIPVKKTHKHTVYIREQLEHTQTIAHKPCSVPVHTPEHKASSTVCGRAHGYTGTSFVSCKMSLGLLIADTHAHTQTHYNNNNIEEVISSAGTWRKTGGGVE